jgi:hypothetical protein
VNRVKGAAKNTDGMHCDEFSVGESG